jgi:L-serine dehydratase
MNISVFDLFKIGIGPSSSHTVGPMRAARQFLLDAREAGVFDRIARVEVALYGSLALTGKGHGTDRAVLLGLAGEEADKIENATIGPTIECIGNSHKINLLGEREIGFDPEQDIVFHREDRLPRHTNGMRYRVFDVEGTELFSEDFYSIGGGFILRGEEPDNGGDDNDIPYPFASAKELLAAGEKAGLRIPQLMRENENAYRPWDETRTGLLNIWQVMQDCVRIGLTTEGTLPGGLRVLRRAPVLHHKLTAEHTANALDVMDWVNLFALAVNEENAAGGRVVTAPTNGAAGIIPAVLHYYRRFVEGANEDGVVDFLLTAGAIGMLYKKNASISGAEMGCQGEVGVACSMAAGGLAAAMGGSNAHIENAAEIGMEHNLGLTCDPIKGLVQIPCIERNAMGAMKAINAQRLAMHGDGTHRVSLDEVIATMRQTGRDMQSIYKETSLGGLAVNVIEC